MTLLKKIKAALPREGSFADLEKLAPAEWWQTRPEYAALYAITVAGCFDGKLYLERNPDVREARMDPLQHYLRHGIWEGREIAIKGQIPAAMRRPKVSVLMPVFNNAAYLRECIESVLGQTLREIELIIVNDGSTDQVAVRIMREYASLDNRIQLINKVNTGYGHSMNVALDAARGEYAAIVESDDYIAPQMLQTLYDHAAKGEYDFVKSNYVEFVDDVRREFAYIEIDKDDARYGRPIDPRQEPQILLAPEIVINPPSLTRLDFIRSHNIRFNESPGASFQDLGFFLQRYLYAAKILYIPDYLYYVRKDNMTSSHKRRDKIFCAYEEYCVIDMLLQRDWQRKQLFGKYVFFRKWNSIKFTMGRIGAEFLDEYLARVGRDLCLSRICGEIDGSIINSYNYALINEICDRQASKPRICAIYTNHLGYGGLERSASFLGEMLKKLGFDVVFILDEPQTVTFPVYGKIVQNTETAFRIVDECLFFIDYKYKPAGSQNPLIRYAVSRYPAKYILTIHNTQTLDNYLGLPLRYMDDAHLPQDLLGAIFCVSSQVKKLVESKCKLPAKIDIIPNAIRLSQTCEPGSSTAGYMLIAARKDAARQKGFDTALAAWAASEAPARGIRLALIGHGRLTEDMEKLVAACPWAHLVDILDFQEDMANIYRQAMCVLAASRWEGFGMVIAEALAVGTPVIATPVGIAEEVIRPGVNGYIVAQEDVADFTAKINLILENYSTFKENLKSWSNPFSPEAIARLLYDALARIEAAFLPSVSVIMPVYNSAATIRRALASVFNQTLANIELICVDDGSTDDSLDLLRQCSDRRLRIYAQEHAGSGPARNLGMAKAAGEYIFFLDSDDYIPDCNALKKMYFTAKRHATNVVAGNLKFDQNGQITENPKRELRFRQDVVYKYSDWQYDFGYYLFMYATHFLRKEKIVFPALLRYQDPPFMVRALNRAASFVGCNVFSYCQSIPASPKVFNEQQAADMLEGMVLNLVYARQNSLKQLIIYTRRHFYDSQFQIEPYKNQPGISNLVTMIHQI